MASQAGQRTLRAALSAAAALRLTDRELLTQFVEGDQSAFAAIVKRHTGMVLGICRRALPTVQDAEDACQAVFLVLARKAKTGRWQSSIANWLYTTARRIASETNRSAARRMKREAISAQQTTVSALDEMTGREAFAALDEELDKLPAIYREPLVLCYLQGLPRDAAAICLGVPAATLKGQLDRGRKKLADALTRRGIDIGAGLIAVAVASSAGASSPRLVESILATVGGSPSASVAAIAKGIAMNGFSLKAKLLALTMVVATVTGFGLVSIQIAAGPQAAAIERTKQPAAKEDAKSNDKPKAEQPAAKADEPKPGDIVEVEIAKGVKMKFCWIPPGKAQLGSPKSEQDDPTIFDDQKKTPPIFDVETETARGVLTTKGFWLGKYTVTQQQWEAVMGTNPSCFSKQGNYKDKVQGMDSSRFPVECVTWKDCQDFLRTLNEKVTIPAAMGIGKFALPHEDQWEYACLGGKGNKQAFYFGNELNGARANCNGNYPYGTTIKGANLERTTEVGSYEKAAPHPWGLCDMSGNVWQWCENKSDVENNSRVLRGGAWNDGPKNCRSAFRYNCGPLEVVPYNGFRVVVVPAKEDAKNNDKPKAEQPAVKADGRQPGDIVEVEIAKGVKMKFCWIPPGKAQLGSPKSEQNDPTILGDHGKSPRIFDVETETARGVLTTKGFWLGKYTVTQQQWEAVMGTNPSCFSKQGNYKDKVQGMDTSRFPVECVTWNDCQDFLKTLNEKVTIPAAMGIGKFVLPHEDQWEYACLGGKGNKQAFYFGSELNGTQANCNGNYPYGTTTKGANLERTTEVGSYEKAVPHPWGLCDMSGNVWQWCENKSDVENNSRILRGGSWDYWPKYCRSAFRNNSAALYLGFNGFRVVVVPAKEDAKNNDKPKAEQPTARADEPPKFKPIDPETIAGYEKLGATFGGFEVDALGDVKFLPGKEATAKRLPGFHFSAPSDGTLPKLPPVQVPFGLDLSGGTGGIGGVVFINDMGFKDEALKDLKDLKNLTTLILISPRLTDAGLKELADLKNLATLSLGLSCTKVTDAGLKELNELKNLTSLDLDGTQVTDSGLKELANLQKLTDLRLGSTKVTDSGLKNLQDLKNLRWLDLGDTKVTDAGVKELADLKNLTSLDLRFTNVTGAGLKEFKNLAALDLYGTQVTDVGLTDLKDLKNLTSLQLNFTRVTDGGLKELADLKNLATLDLSHTQTTGVGLKHLKDLSMLNLCDTQVTDAGLKELKELTNLTDLRLGNTKVTDEGLKELANLKKLFWLYLKGTKVTDAGLKELMEALPRCRGTNALGQEFVR